MWWLWKCRKCFFWVRYGQQIHLGNPATAFKVWRSNKSAQEQMMLLWNSTEPFFSPEVTANILCKSLESYQSFQVLMTNNKDFSKMSKKQPKLSKFGDRNFKNTEEPSCEFQSNNENILRILQRSPTLSKFGDQVKCKNTQSPKIPEKVLSPEDSLGTLHILPKLT